jgi:hypothetical protein
VIAALLVDAAFKPDTFCRTRSATVTWAMHGPTPYLNRLTTIFFDMDKTVGKDFEAGLANLKALAAKP